MIITDHYRFERLPDTKSKTRVDCVTSTGTYPEFEQMRNRGGELFVYLTDVPESFKGGTKRKAHKAISKTKNISSIYVPDFKLPYGYGDVRGTNDAILFQFNSDFTEVDLFIVRGQKSHSYALYTMLVEGELLNEIESLKKRGKDELL